jgi:uncharacterized protein (DUF924 family)
VIWRCPDRGSLLWHAVARGPILSSGVQNISDYLPSILAVVCADCVEHHTHSASAHAAGVFVISLYHTWLMAAPCGHFRVNSSSSASEGRPLEGTVVDGVGSPAAGLHAHHGAQASEESDEQPDACCSSDLIPPRCRQDVNRVLTFWFGEQLSRLDRRSMWFGADPDLDQQIVVRFERLVAAALRGELDEWDVCPQGLLAHIVVLNQFTRHCFRGCGKAFMGDCEAARLCVFGLDRGWFGSLPEEQRVFALMPLQHVEDINMQQVGALACVRWQCWTAQVCLGWCARRDTVALLTTSAASALCPPRMCSAGSKSGHTCSGSTTTKS